MKIINVPINDVKPYPNNPRNNDDAVKATANSIKEFGWQQPIVVDKNYVIIVGHTRLKAAQMLGLSEVPITVANLTEEKANAYRLADNKTGELADWNMELLQNELSKLDDIDMSDFGFSDDLNSLDDDEAIDDDFTPEPPEEPQSKLGQIYQLGSHRLMCGDSTNSRDVRRLLNEEKAAMLLTDPPYNINYHGKTKTELKIENDNMGSEEFRQFLTAAFAAADENMQSGAAFYIWHADSERYNFEGACADIGWKVRQNLIWNKSSMTLGRQDYQWKHEPCLYGWTEGTHHWYTDRSQTTVLDFDKPTSSELHPTMKPVPLFDYQIKNSSLKDDIVLDLFGGSGTTIIACEQNHRRGYLMELDPRYVDVIIKRWQDFTGKKARLLGDTDD
ncbi:hypothetical protein DS832_07030 [Bombilactobacillus bombi]|uniref:Methyltransferase n=1 Tax=Bombilactobacillus bombi TaxID=1303590 RepID=A0A417Z663_9LACO|nr:DNA modification methylase [Bombilactobacillus bombi]RHW46096.1 hypothetical protein DS832_07030 [Bombilactobacillus bombi]